MNKQLFILWVVAAGGPCFLHAQHSSSSVQTEMPSAPFVARAADYSAWRIDVSQKKPASNPSPTPTEVGGVMGVKISQPTPKIIKNSVVTKTGSILRDVITYTDGTTIQNWWIHGKLIRQNPEAGYINIIDPVMDRAAPQFNSSDFEGLAWIDLEHYSGTGKQNGFDCFVYEWKERMVGAGDVGKIKNYASLTADISRFKGKPKIPMRAWIEMESKMPLFAEDENATYTYTYLDPPSETLALPAAFKKEWETYKETADNWKSHVMPKQR